MSLSYAVNNDVLYSLSLEKFKSKKLPLFYRSLCGYNGIPSSALLYKEIIFLATSSTIPYKPSTNISLLNPLIMILPSLKPCSYYFSYFKLVVFYQEVNSFNNNSFSLMCSY